MIKIFNGTQHKINIFEAGQTFPVQDGRKLVIKEGELPVAVIEAGTNLNCSKENGAAPSLETNIPLVGAVKFVSHDPLPEGYDIYVVSNLYRAAVAELGGDTSKLATVNGTVFDSEEAIRPCGCLGLAVG